MMLMTLFRGVSGRFLVPFQGTLWGWHVVAALVTALLVWSGLDWKFFLATRGEAWLPLVIWSGVGGMVVPIAVPLGLYMAGRIRQDAHLLLTAAAVAQASLIAWVIVAVYKALTGRIQPDLLYSMSGATLSGFQFGFWEHGIFWGWPSHHTVVAVAGATVMYLALRQPAARFGALAWAGIVAAGAAVGFHWFSDMVAGAIVGAVVGAAVWRDIRKQP